MSEPETVQGPSHMFVRLYDLYQAHELMYKFYEQGMKDEVDCTYFIDVRFDSYSGHDEIAYHIRCVVLICVPAGVL